jgi:hypothetical protein
MSIFVLGALLAALGGVIGGGSVGAYLGLDFEILPLPFPVIIISFLRPWFASIVRPKVRRTPVSSRRASIVVQPFLPPTRRSIVARQGLWGSS